MSSRGTVYPARGKIFINTFFSFYRPLISPFTQSEGLFYGFEENKFYFLNMLDLIIFVLKVDTAYVSLETPCSNNTAVTRACGWPNALCLRKRSS